MVKRTLRQILNDPAWVDALHNRINKQKNDSDRHRVYAHGQIDARLEAGKITPKKAIELKRKWDKRHGY